MRQVLTILFVIAAIWIGVKFQHYFKESMDKAQVQIDGQPRTAPGKLPGLSIDLEPSLEEAKKNGADGIRTWLGQHRNDVEDPRYADIQLDYVVLVGRNNPAEAKRVLAAIKARVGTNSRIQKRLEQIEKVYP